MVHLGVDFTVTGSHNRSLEDEDAKVFIAQWLNEQGHGACFTSYDDLSHCEYSIVIHLLHVQGRFHIVTFRLRHHIDARFAYTIQAWENVQYGWCFGLTVRNLYSQPPRLNLPRLAIAVSEPEMKL